VTFTEAKSLFGQILDGALSDAQIADTLVEIADRGETADEIAGAAAAMRARMIRVSAPEGAIDVCGTGGDGQHSLNVSTAVAIVVAACEVPVAKHGNRAASSKAGGADTLEALGLNLNRASETAEETLADLGIAFLFAQKHHPALARIAPIRKSLGRRTIFNLLGPLCNPASVTRQLVGVSSPSVAEIYAHVLQDLGAKRFMVVNGAIEVPGKNAVLHGDEPALDELSISGPSIALEYPSRYNQEHQPIGWERGICFDTMNPEHAGLPYHPIEALKGGDAVFNAGALRRLLNGEAGAYRDAVLLNAAGALIVAGRVSDWKEGAEEAAEAIDRGLAKALLDCWIAY
jgi:anthranilate phosphoribosyltransferase